MRATIPAYRDSMILFVALDLKPAAYGKDPLIVAAVKTENAKGKTLDQVKTKDKERIATAGIADYMQAVMNSEGGACLRSIQKSEPYFCIERRGLFVDAVKFDDSARAYLVMVLSFQVATLIAPDLLPCFFF